MRRTVVICACIFVLALVPPVAAAALPGSAQEQNSSSGSEGSSRTPPPPLGADIEMICGDSQVDVNHASREAMATTFRLPVPVAARIVEQRPFGGVWELAAVPGLTPTKFTELTPLACATPLTTPPPAPDPCDGADDADLNNPEHRVRLAEIFGGPTAERILEESQKRPFLALSNARAPRVPGDAVGKIEKRREDLCVTPRPVITTDGSRFGWAYAGDGITLDHVGGATLTIHPAILDDPVGAWSSITPAEPIAVPDGVPNFPAFDLHVYDEWQDDGETVDVTLPVDPVQLGFGPNEARPMLVHWQGPSLTNADLISGTRLTVEGGRATAAVDDLSIFASITEFLIEDLVDHAYRLIGERYGPPGCDPPFDRPEGISLTSGVVELPGAIAPGGWPLKHCLQQGADAAGNINDNLAFKARNATDTMMTVRQTLGSGGVQATYEVLDVAGPSALLVKAIWDALGMNLVLPGSSALVTVPPGTTAAIDMHPDGAATITYGTIKVVLSLTLDNVELPEALDDFVTDLIEDSFLCALTTATSAAGGIQAFQNGSLSEMTNTVIGYLDDCIDTEDVVEELLEKAEEVGSEAAESAIKTLANAFNRLEMFLDIADPVISVSDTLVWGSWIDNGLVLIDHRAPRPIHDGRGDLYGPGCVTLRNDGLTWNVDEACQQAFLRSLTSIPIVCDQTGTCTANPQPAGGGTGGGDDDGNPCVSYDYLSGSFIIDADAGQGCLLPEQYTWCGFGSCVPIPSSFGRVVELTDGRSGYIGTDGRWFHLLSTDAYYDCLAGGQPLRSPHTASGKWYPDNLNNLTFGGDITGC